MYTEQNVHYNALLKTFFYIVSSNKSIRKVVFLVFMFFTEGKSSGTLSHGAKSELPPPKRCFTTLYTCKKCIVIHRNVTRTVKRFFSYDVKKAKVVSSAFTGDKVQVCKEIRRGGRRGKEVNSINFVSAEQIQLVNRMVTQDVASDLSTPLKLKVVYV